MNEIDEINEINIQKGGSAREVGLPKLISSPHLQNGHLNPLINRIR